MPEHPDIRWFTARHNGRVLELRTNSVGVNAAGAPIEIRRAYSAIWDTGATHTNVTAKVVRECGLIPSGIADSIGVHGRRLTNTYLIDVYLPNGVVVQGVEANEADSLPGSDDVLIGMDIIGMGDFAVSNYRGRTTFTFRMPSQAEIDFQPRQHAISRNAPCPCGSRKRYRKCCGSPDRRRVTPTPSSVEEGRPRCGRSR